MNILILIRLTGIFNLNKLHMTNYNYVFNQFPILETERLILREFQESDVKNFYNMCLHEDYVDEFCTEGTYMSLEDTYNSITWKYKQSFNSKEDLTWAIVLKESGDGYFFTVLKPCYKN